VSVVKINAITVPEEMRDTLEERFRNRAREVEELEGFEGFQLLRPTDGADRYFVVTWWRSDEDFERWLSSDAFRRGHAGGGSPGGASPHGGEVGSSPGDQPRRPAGTASELLSFEVVLDAGPAER
jgi:heme oxygenase (mycobilin-producing)